MSKVTLTSILKLGLIFFGITILYTSCEREDDHSMVSEKMDNLNKDFNFNQKSFNELKNNSKFIKAFKKAIKTKSVYKSKSTKKDIYDFSIDSSSINVLKHKEITYYTMLISRKNSNSKYYENLLIKVDSLEHSNAFLLKYTPKSKTKYLEHHNSFNFSGDVNITAIEYDKINNSKSQYTCYQTTEIWCSWKWDHVASGSCFSHNHLYAKTVTKCGYSDDGSESGDYSDDEDDSTSGGGDGINHDLEDINNEDSNQLYTIPIDCKWNCPDEFDEESGCAMGYMIGEDGGCVEVIVDAPDDPIANLEEFLSCLDKTKGAIVTIYAKQPDPSNPNVPATKSNLVGHAYITITQGQYTLSYGFYPEKGTGYLNATNGIMGRNQNYPFHVSISNTISNIALNNLITLSLDYDTAEYELQQQNCTNFAVSAANVIGLDVPLSATVGFYGIGQGATPGKFGAYLKNMNLPTGATRIKAFGTSPSNKECPY